MKKMVLTMGALLVAGIGTAYAQGSRDTDPYPGYNREFRPDPSLLIHRPWTMAGARPMTGRRPMEKDMNVLPDHWSNMGEKYMRPVFNQIGGSCGPSSRIGYMFTYEMNAYRDKDASKLENQYPTHFVYPYSYDNLSKDAFATYVGIPNGVTYSGDDCSTIYGCYESNVNNAGWMTGYEKWYEAMHNRITGFAHFSVGTNTEEGRTAIKWWLYNHNGDPDFRGVGGILGLGCAISDAGYATVPNTPANTATGLVGKKILHHWDPSVDHAVTLVGYDDRLEFDLDENGVYGEESNSIGQLEKGAWIILNSWGTGFGNQGTLYVPYGIAGGSSKEVTTPAGKTVWDKADDGWFPEIYNVRKNYKVERTLKLNFSFTKRSEIGLKVGIAKDLNATQPEEIITVRNINFQGDADGDGVDAEMPLLGKWADGKIHGEPMEFGYDLTDLTAKFDATQPLKYFFIVDSKAGATGVGGIHKASIMDYMTDANGIENPFTIAGDSVKILNGGQRTMISVIVNGESLGAPRNLTLTGNALKWEQPVAGAEAPVRYDVYEGANLLASVTDLSFTLATVGSEPYTVKAVYGAPGAERVSAASNGVRPTTTVTANDKSYNFKNGGFTIKDIFKQKFEEATIEFRVRANSMKNHNQQIGPGWDTFKAWATSDGKLQAGWQENDRATSTKPCFSRIKWNHVAIVINGSEVRIFLDGKPSGMRISSNNGGIGGFGDLVFGSTIVGEGLDGQYDEVRIWKEARTEAQIKQLKDGSIAVPAAYENLMAYYQMDTFEQDGVTYLRDVLGNYDAPLLSGMGEAGDDAFKGQTPALQANISAPASANVFEEVALADSSNYHAASWSWLVEGKTYNVKDPKVVFTTPGTKVVKLTVTDPSGVAQTVEKSIVVNAVELTADFDMSATSVSGTDRVSFLSKNTMSGCQYAWTMEGANVTTASTRNASAAYSSSGAYNVTLKVTSPSGEVKEVTKTVNVVPAAPVAKYTVSPAIINLGESVTLTDGSAYSPTEFYWQLISENNVILAQGQNAVVTPTKPGVYRLVYRVKNAQGETRVEQQRAVIVCNEESGKGLTLSGSQYIAVPAAGKVNNTWTLDYWMKTSTLSAVSNGIKAGDFTLTFDGNGRMNLTKGTEVLSSNARMVGEDEWHHVAVSYNNRVVTFYADGKKVSEKIATSDLHLGNFEIGGEAPLNGQIDEFRLWNKSLTQEELQAGANKKIAPTSPGLVLYYQFEQSGDLQVNDATANGIHGTRRNVGPSGDAWSSSDGVFALDFSVPTFDDVTAGREMLNTANYEVIAWSSQDESSERNLAKLALDRKENTFWHTRWNGEQPSFPHSITIRRNSNDTIQSLMFSQTDDWNHHYFAASVKVESSANGTDWVVREENMPLLTAAKTGTNLSAPITDPYVRLTFLESASNSTFLAMNEIYFYGQPVKFEDANVSGLRVIDHSASSSGTTYSDPNAVIDGNESTAWRAKSMAAYPAYLTFQRDTEDPIYRATFRFASIHTSTSYRPGKVTLLVSDNGTDWTEKVVDATFAYSSDNKEGVVNFKEPITSKFFKMNFTEGVTNTTKNLGINEITFQTVPGASNGGTTAIDQLPVRPSVGARKGIYDLQGRRVTKPTRGIYIIDGKKVLVK